MLFRLLPPFLIIILIGAIRLGATNEVQFADWRPLRDLTNHTEILSTEYSEEGKVQIMTPRQKLRLFEGLRRLEINDALYWMNGPLLQIDKEWKVSQADLENTLAPLVTKTRPEVSRRPFIVVLDPGHGGQDPGALAHGHQEKDIVLKVSLLLQEKLQEAGITTALTRTNDVFIALEDRPILARQMGASVFISVHANQAASGMANGIESFILPAADFPGTSNSRAPYKQSMTANRFDVQNLMLADALQRPMIRATGAFDRGIKRERFAVLRDAPCPAVLIEIGFMSNPVDLANMLDPVWIDKLTDALRDGILSTKPEHQASQ